MRDLTLHPINQDGSLGDATITLPSEADGVLEATSALYARVGFVPPWLGYVVTEAGVPVGMCAFKSAPVEARAEIAYFTFPAFEGEGIATVMGQRLIEIALATDPQVMVAAQTMIERNASHRVLEKLGFVTIGTVIDPQDGPVLEWRRAQNG